MPDLSLPALLALRDKLRAATGPDYGLEWEIQAVTGGRRTSIPPKYASSLDATIAMIDRALPGAVWTVSRNATGALAAVGCEDDPPWMPAGSTGPTPPIAILIALFEALIARAEREGGR